MLSTLVAAVLVGPIVLGPPPTRAEQVVENVHGRQIVDEYRWLESLESEDDAVAAWTTEQNNFTRDVLESIPGRDELEQRLAEFMTLPSVSAPTMRANRYFYRERQGEENQAVLYMREGYDGQASVVLNPNELDESGLVSLDWTSPSHDGQLLAFGLSYAGDENSTLYVLEVDTGKWLADEISGKVRMSGWLPDASGFFYRDLADLDNPYSGRVRFHRLGTHPRQDKTLFEQYPDSTTWGPAASISRDARWMLLSYWTGTKSNDLWVIDLDRWFRTGEFVQVDIIVGDDSTSSGSIIGDTLFLKTTMDAVNGQVFRVDLNMPARENWTNIIPQRSDGAVLRGVSMARGQLVASYLKSAATELQRFDFDGRPLGTIELPGIGSGWVSTERDRTEAFLTFTSFNDPTSIWRMDLLTGERAIWERLDVPFDPDSIEVQQVWYPSRDGTKVSMFLVHRKGLERDGDNPTLLYGYGGFNISMTPSFRATRIPWLEAGGVYAIANLRGGGEYGKQWHEAGMLDQKQNVFDDFISAAEWLIEQRYTNSRRLAIMGGSNGGLLVGAAVTQRPELFSGAVCAVPLLDMLRYDQFLMAKYWVPEYGDPADPTHFEWLAEYSPYHNIDENVKYPAILFTAGENDTRVHPLHARKMAARLQEVAANNFDDNPIMLWVDRSSGHGAGKPLRLRIRDAADIWSFTMWQTGLLGDPRK